MKLWVTGANGLVGSCLKPFAQLATGHEVDITDLSRLKKFVSQNPGITHIVNSAAQAGVDPAETHKEETFKVNAIGPENLGLIASEIGASLLHLSTDYVFRGDLKRPLKETDEVAPCNHYGMTKLEGEKRLAAVFPKACILRISWVFGRGGKNFIAKLLQFFQTQEVVRLTNDQWGRPTYASDLAPIILKMLDKSGIYQFANAGVATKYEFGALMLELLKETGIPLKIKRLESVPGSTFPSPAIRPIYSAFDTSKIERELKIHIRPWQEALKEFLCALSPASL
jgi:dTDP-4-dehydrorhamnose reductase